MDKFLYLTYCSAMQGYNMTWISALPCKATEGDLTPEYKEERDRLVKKLKSGLVPKEKNGVN